MTSHIFFPDDVKCMAKSMKITVFPAGEFSGKIHLKGHNGCDFTYVSGKSGPMELEVDDAKCGGVTTDHVRIIYK